NVVPTQVQPAKKTPMSLDEQIEALRRVLQQLEEQKRKAQGQPDFDYGSGPRYQLEEQKRKAHGQPPEKTSPKDAKIEQKVLTPEEAIKQRPKEKVTVQFKVTAARTFLISRSNVVGKSAGFSGEGEGLILKGGDSFAVQLPPPVMDTIRRLGI